jgi:hypothetical protein
MFGATSQMSSSGNFDAVVVLARRTAYLSMLPSYKYNSTRDGKVFKVSSVTVVTVESRGHCVRSFGDDCDYHVCVSADHKAPRGSF